jgi:hypothetical protein
MNLFDNDGVTNLVFKLIIVDFVQLHTDLV